jgi:hypothetical protein
MPAKTCPRNRCLKKVAQSPPVAGYVVIHKEALCVATTHSDRCVLRGARLAFDADHPKGAFDALREAAGSM